MFKVIRPRLYEETVLDLAFEDYGVNKYRLPVLAGKKTVLIFCLREVVWLR